MTDFSGDTTKPDVFNGTKDPVGGTDSVGYNNSRVGATIVPGDDGAGLPRYTDSFGNIMFAIELLDGSNFKDRFSVGYDLSRGAPVSTAEGSPFERHFLLSISMDDGNDVVNILNRLPAKGYFDLHWPDLGGFSSFDGAVINGGRGNDTINGGSLQDLINGGEGDDVLRGGDGNDIISSGGGNDLVLGGFGDDTISLTDAKPRGLSFVNGGAGRDTITLSQNVTTKDVIAIKDIADSGPSSRDAVWYFNVAVDLISVHDIDANTNKRGDQDFHLVKDFTGHAGELQWDFNSNGGTFTQTAFSGDINGDGVSDFGVVLIAGFGLSAQTSLETLEQGFVL